MSDSDSNPVFDKAAALFGLMSNPTRLKILCLLCERERSVTELRAELLGTPPSISQHLSMLFRSGVVERRRDGSHLRYRIASQQLDMLCSLLRAEQSRSELHV